MSTQISPLNETINEVKRRRGGQNRISLPDREELAPWLAKLDWIDSVKCTHSETGQWYESINGHEPFRAFDTLVWVWLRWRAAERKLGKARSTIKMLESELALLRGES